MFYAELALEAVQLHGHIEKHNATFESMDPSYQEWSEGKCERSGYVREQLLYGHCDRIPHFVFNGTDWVAMPD